MPSQRKIMEKMKLNISVNLLQAGMYIDSGSAQYGYGVQPVLEVKESTHPDYLNIVIRLPWEDVMDTYCEEWDCEHCTYLTVLKTSRVEVMLDPHYRDENTFCICGFEE